MLSPLSMVLDFRWNDKMRLETDTFGIVNV